MSNGALVHHPTTRSEPADLTVELTRQELLGAIARGSTDGLRVEGDPSVFIRLLSFTDEPTPRSPSSPRSPSGTEKGMSRGTG